MPPRAGTAWFVLCAALLTAPSEALAFASGGGALSVDDVAFGVLTCHQYLGTRLHAQQRTWLRHVKHVMAFTDEAPPDADKLGIELVVEKPPMGPKEMLEPGHGARRALGALEALHRRFPEAKWYFFVDDDTFVYVPTLLTEVLGRRSPDSPHYVGWAYRAGRALHGWAPGQYRPQIAIGGAGFAISAKLMAELVPQVPACRSRYTWDWPGDLRIAQCVSDLGYGVEDEARLHPEAPRYEATWRDLWTNGEPPVSFHHLAPQEVMQLYEAEVVRRYDKLGTLDFASLALAEVSHEEPSLGLTFHARWGLEVNVSGRAGAPMSADVMQSFQAAAPASGHDFEQAYMGAACPRHPGSRVKVRLDLRCGDCPSGSATRQRDGPLAACGAEALGACSYRLLLATQRCPAPKTPATAPMTGHPPAAA